MHDTTAPPADLAPLFVVFVLSLFLIVPDGLAARSSSCRGLFSYTRPHGVALSVGGNRKWIEQFCFCHIDVTGLPIVRRSRMVLSRLASYVDK